MIFGNDPLMIIQNPQADIDELREPGVLRKEWCSACTAEFLLKTSGNVVAGYLILPLGDADIRCRCLNIGCKGGAAQLLTDGTIAKASVGRLAFELELDTPTLTLPCSHGRRCA